MDPVTQVQFLDEAVCISHSDNTLEKCMNPTILSSCGYRVEQTGFFQRGVAAVPRLKMDLVSHPARSEVIG